MSWKIELYRAFFVVLGTSEVIANTKYLLQKDGLTKARKQHQELPKNATEKNMKVKVICMLIVGIMLLCVGLASYILHQPLKMCTIISLVLLTAYAIIEAFYYKYRNTFGFAAVAIAVTILYIFIK